MINTSFSQNAYKTIVFEKTTLTSGDKGLALNESAMDKVYKKYLDFDKLKNSFELLVLDHEILKLNLFDKNKELLFEKQITNDLRKVIILTDTNHSKEVKLIRQQLKKARLNSFKVSGIAAVIIGLIIINK